MTKLMPWVGGKAQLMWAIQMLLPTHYKTLVDVFGGSGIITMNTSVPSGCLQIYNDLNHDLYNLLFCAKERPLELVRELGFLPINAHDEFDVLQRQLQGEDFTMEYMERQLDLTEVFFEPPQAEVVRQLLLERGSLGNVRRAAAFYKLQRYSYNGSGDSYGVGSCDIRRFFRDLWECSHRLKDAVLENKDFESIITARNDPQTVAYCDPPYYEAECYTVEFPRSDHQRLHDVLVKHGGCAAGTGQHPPPAHAEWMLPVCTGAAFGGRRHCLCCRVRHCTPTRPKRLGSGASWSCGGLTSAPTVPAPGP